MRSLASSMRSLACMLIAALSLSAAPARGADDPGATARPATLAGSAKTVVARMIPVPAAALPQGAAPATTGSGEGFMSTRRGRIALVLLAAGIGWAVYSHSHDRIKSPIR